MAKFRVKCIAKEDRNIERWLVYNNETNELYDQQTGRSVLPSSPSNPFQNQNKVKKHSRHDPISKNSPRILKISLGLSCNYECEYCSQRFVPRAEETNPNNVDDFINSLDTWVTKPPNKIEFWGGEPFVYIKTLKPLAEKLKIKYPDARMSIITNGSLLTKELNNWIDQMGFLIGISHDGPGQPTRGPDPLEDPETREAILDLYKRLQPKNAISFNSMIHANNYSRADIQKFFVNFTGDKNVNIGEGGIIDPYDEGGLANSLMTEDEHTSFRYTTYQDYANNRATNFRNVNQRIMNFIEVLEKRQHSDFLSQKCGMDKEDTIAVDLKGNVLTCQNVSIEGTAPNGESHHVGHVSDLKNVKLKTSTHWSQREECPNCPVLWLCQGACMFLDGVLWERACDNSFSDNIVNFSVAIEHLTGLLPVYIEGPQREDRKEIWKASQVKTNQKIIPIKVDNYVTTTNI